MINFLRKKLKIEDDKFYVCLEVVGNTVSSTIPIALWKQKRRTINREYITCRLWSGILLGRECLKCLRLKNIL